MSGSRSLYDILTQAFNDPEIKKNACHSANNILKNYPERATRVFDKFPCLLPEDLLTEKIIQFKDMISLVKESSLDITSDGPELINETDKSNLCAFEKEIAKMARKELLTKMKTIKPELIELLGWEEFEKQLNSSSLICAINSAYVGAVNQAIIQKLDLDSEEIEKKKMIFGGIFNYINNNCHNWVKEACGYVIIAPKNKKDKSDKWKYEKILHWPIEKPKPGVFVVLTAVATVAAILFFKRTQNHTNEEKIIPRPLKP